MSANLNIRDGRYSMAFRGSRDAIWHRCGQILPDNPSFADVVSAAGLDYTIAKRPIFARQSDGIMVPVPDQYTLVRTDTDQPLPVTVGSKYKPIQNLDLFGFLEAFEGLTYDTAGVLGYGERAWVMSCYDALSFDVGNDKIRNNILMVAVHGLGCALACSTPTRVICQNTMTMALYKAQRVVKIRHTSGWRAKLAEVERVLDLNRTYTTELARACERLALRRLSPGEAFEAFKSLVPEDSTRAQNVRGELLNLFSYGTGNHGETAWDWLNAVTEYADHARTVRGANKAEQRFKSSVLEGSAVAFKQRAFDLITAA